MNLDWQTAAVLLAIAAACVYLARAAWQTVVRRKAGACGGCGTCPQTEGADELETVALGGWAESARAAAPEEARRNGTPGGRASG